MLVIGPLVDVDQEPAETVRRRGARDSAVQAGECNGETAAGEPDPVRHLGDRSDLRVFALVLGHEEDLILVTDVDRQRDAHVREDDDVVQGDQQQPCHRIAHNPLRSSGT